MKNPSCDEGDRLGAILAEVFAGLAHGQAAGSDEVEGEIADRGERRAPARTRQRSSSIDTSRT